MSPLLECCIPTPDAGIAERLYCAYNQGGPAARAGLAWNGQPCPTWSDLVQRAGEGDPGAAGVVAKWEAAAEEAVSLLTLNMAADKESVAQEPPRPEPPVVLTANDEDGDLAAQRERARRAEALAAVLQAELDRERAR